MSSQFDNLSNLFTDFSGFEIPEVKEEEPLSLSESEVTSFGGGFSNLEMPDEISEIKEEETLSLSESEVTSFGGDFSNLGMPNEIPEIKEEEALSLPKSMISQRHMIDLMQKVSTTEPSKQNAMDFSIFEIDSMNETISSSNDFFNGLLLDTTIATYDSDVFQAELPAYPMYCTIEVDPNLVSKDPKWIDMCIQACPSTAQEMLNYLIGWMQEKIHLSRIPKFLCQIKSGEFQKFCSNR